MQSELQAVYEEHMEGAFGETNSMQAIAPNRPWIKPHADGGLSPTEHAEHAAIDPASFVAKEVGLSEGTPRLALDAACASALYCLKTAQDYLSTGAADMMLCGASCFPEPMFVLSGFSAFQALPSKNSGLPSAPFERETAGLTPGEGGAILVLKRLSDAEAAGDRIYGTLLGACVSNSGTGQPLKPHMPSEYTCMRDTYARHGIDPATLQYMECHATGTPQGDACELEALRRLYESSGTHPLIGSTKGNFGHTLVAAGFAGAAKLLLAMNRGVIPATPKVAKPLDANVLTQNAPWPEVASGAPKRAGLSAFGFGGTNAHAVFEEYKPELARKPAAPLASPVPCAIVGMAAHFGTLKDLAALERAIHDGGDAACELPAKRWRFLTEDATFKAKLPGAPSGDKPMRGCFVGDIDVDYGRLKLPLLPEDQLQPQHLLALSNIDKALLDCGDAIQKGAKVAVLVGLGTDMELYRHRARVALRERLGLAPGDELSAEQEALLSHVSDVSTSTSYTSNIGNIIATRIASAWGFVGPAFTVTQGANSVFRCLELAACMLATGEIDGAVVAGVDLGGSAEALYAKTRLPGIEIAKGDHPSASFESDATGFFVGEGCGALVIKRKADASADRVYASIDAVAEAATVGESAAAALASAGVAPSDVEYVEVSADGPGAIDTDEVAGVASAYAGPSKRAALGTVKSNVGHVGYSSGAAALIKAALCLYHRYLPKMPRWTAPKPEVADTLDASSLYVCPASRAWVKNAGATRRAAVSGVSTTSPGSKFHILLSDAMECYEEGNVISLDAHAPKLLAIRADSARGVASAVAAAIGRIEAAADAKKAADAEFATLLVATVADEKQGGAPRGGLTLCLVTTAEKLLKELQLAAKGVASAAETGKDFVSPSGSFFTPALI